MTRECDDTDDAPGGSIADLRAEFASAVGEFEARAQEDLAKRADGRPIAQRTEAEPSIGGDPDAGGFISDPTTFDEVRQPPFNPEPVLLVPHFEAEPRRPIPQRQRIANTDALEYEAVHPLRSDALTVRASDGAETDIVEAGETYTVACDLWNVGGLPARNAVVELFVEHETPEAAVDTSEETGRFEVRAVTPDDGRPYWNYVLSGTTTMAPGSQLFAYFHQGESKAPPYSGLLGGTPISPRTGRTFENTSATGFDRGTEEQVFTVDLWDVSRVEDNFSESALEENGIHLAQLEGEIVGDNPIDDRRTVHHDLTAGVNLDADATAEGSARRVGKRNVSVPQNDSRTITFEYTPSEAEFPNADLQNAEGLPPGAGRSVTALYVRTHSLATNEVPGDWGGLDHTESRFMGRTEVGRML